MGLLLGPGPSHSPKSADASVWLAGGNPLVYPRKLGMSTGVFCDSEEKMQTRKGFSP